MTSSQSLRKQQLPTLNTDLEDNAAGAVYQVIKEFNARLDDELTLKLGDKIELISDDQEFNDGWYMGKSLSTGKVGLYPKSFTELVPSLSRPSLLRARSRRIASPTLTQSPISTKSTTATPTSFNAPRFNDTNNKNYNQSNNNIHNHINNGGLSARVTPKKEPEPVEEQEEESHQLSGALSDIDRALEELKNDVKPQIHDTSYATIASTESLNPETVDSWSPEQVTNYFKYLGFDANSSEQFAKHKITGAILLELELTYLKELDISSFGTRFEIYKEIEALKELINQKKTNANNIQHTFDEEDEYTDHEESNTSKPSLLAAPEVRRTENLSANKNIEEDLETFTRPLGHTRKKSKSLDDIPETSKQRSSQQPQSLLRNRNSFVPPSSQVPDIPHEQFLSPRRAPNPPSYPSPIQLREDTFNNQNTPTVKRNSIHHSRTPSYDVNPAFQLKANGHSRKSSTDYGHSKQHSRNFKSASSYDLLNPYNDSGRPASSIYPESNAHSRHSSVNLRHGNNNNSNKHSRNLSDFSIKASDKGEKSSHRRHSSVFSFLSASNNFNSGSGNISPTRQTPGRPTSVMGSKKKLESPTRNSIFFNEETGSPTLDPNVYKRRSVSAKNADKDQFEDNNQDDVPPSPTKRSVSEAVRNKTLRTISSSTTLKKSQTSAFMEGIRNIGPAESIKTADCYGWMNKKGGIAVGTWKQRYFTLHGTRLSYFTSLSDTRERGLIDITSHKVLPARDDDKFVSLYAATTGNGKFCFKLVPPAPGSRKGLTFTQPKVHYFAVETKEEMRAWMAALIKSTIDIDESVPVLSSCATPTVSLQKAQTLLAQARENARKREELNRLKTEEFNKPDLSGSSSMSPDTDSYDSNIVLQSPNTTVNTSEMTPNINNEANGFGSPYEIASNIYTPKSNGSSANQSPVDTEFKSKPYSSGALRHPSTRVNSSNPISAAAAAAALSSANFKASKQPNRI